MRQESQKTVRILLYGCNEKLLETRAFVLRSAGLLSDFALDLETLKALIAAPESACAVVVCCHSVSDDEYREVIEMASGNGIASLQLSVLHSPQKLIDDVRRLIWGTVLHSNQALKE